MGASVALSPPESNPLETQIVECLREIGGFLTIKQLEARVPSGQGELEAALDSLVEKRLLLRLNTIIPSYEVRVSSDQASPG